MRPSLLALSVLALFTSAIPATSAGASTSHACRSAGHCEVSAVPVGPTNSSEPSGEAPLSPTALSGYRRVFLDDFQQSPLSHSWSTFAGQPGSDPGAQWAPSHVTEGSGVLSLNAWRDPAYGNSWVTGGLCVCQQAQTYGAYFVRARMTGPGATFVGLLWPTNGGWPPEIDFTETYGALSRSMATVHYGTTNQQIHQVVQVDMTAWHTWGVIWTPHSLTYTLDGRVWGRVRNPLAIPHVRMSLHLQQQTWCSLGYACPTQPVSTQIDWVEIFHSIRLKD